MDAEVQPGEADEENDQGARDRQAPPVLASEAQGNEQVERTVQGDGDKWEARRRAGSKSSTATLRWLGRPECEVLFSRATGRKPSRLRNWAFRATAIMEKLINTAPTTGESSILTGASTSSAKGIATTL